MVSHDLLLFMLKIETTTLRNKFHAIRRFPTGSFAVYIGDHLRSNLGIISGLGIICGHVGDHLRRCTVPLKVLHNFFRTEFPENYLTIDFKPKFSDFLAKW